MKFTLITLVTALLSTSAFAQRVEVHSADCKTEIALVMQIASVGSAQPSPAAAYQEWFFDASGERSKGWGQGTEKMKYDNMREIVNLGYKLTPVMNTELNLAKAKPGDLHIKLHLLCGSDSNVFCVPTIFLTQAIMQKGRLVPVTVMKSALPHEVDGRNADAAIFGAIGTIARSLPRCSN